MQAIIYGGGFDTETQDPACHTQPDPGTQAQQNGTDAEQEPLWQPDTTQQATAAHPDDEEGFLDD